ncbi:MAG: hypothetical protein WCY18_01930 [Methanofastidiosum sp.]
MLNTFAIGGMWNVGIIGLVVLVLLDALFLWIGAKFAGINDSSYWKAILGVVVLIVLSAILGSFFGSLGLIGTIISFVVALWAIKSIYETSWLKAFLALILAYVAFMVLAAIFSNLTIF